MAILDILHYPDARLHTVAQPVKAVDASIKRLIDDMAQTMYDAPGIGLAATQVNAHVQLILIDISESKDDLLVLINPKITERSGEQDCLSVPGVYDTVRRADRVTVQALDRDGKPFTLKAEGLLSVCIQHEMDHLLGKVFIEYLSPLKRNRIKNKMLKQQRDR
jgi:peptide deformylase